MGKTTVNLYNFMQHTHHTVFSRGLALLGMIQVITARFPFWNYSRNAMEYKHFFIGLSRDLYIYKLLTILSWPNDSTDIIKVQNHE
jgi:hypothetical protein